MKNDPRLRGEKCQQCGKRYLTIYALPDEIWEKIADGKNLLCPTCADKLAREAGIQLYWAAGQDFFPVVEVPLHLVQRPLREIKESMRSLLPKGEK